MLGSCLKGTLDAQHWYRDDQNLQFMVSQDTVAHRIQQHSSILIRFLLLIFNLDFSSTSCAI